jgi:hypothetical protein
MNEVYKAMQSLNCVWYQVNNYRVVCQWEYTPGLLPEEECASTDQDSHVNGTSISIDTDEEDNLSGAMSNGANSPVLSPSTSSFDMGENGHTHVGSGDNEDDPAEMRPVGSPGKGVSADVPMNGMAVDSSSQNSNGGRLFAPQPKIKIALSLYKVQQNIYLLDFQRVEGDAFSFMKLCAFIITELKNLSAASRTQSQQHQQQQMAAQMHMAGSTAVR